MTDERFTIRWFATGDVERHKAIHEVWEDARNNGGVLKGAFIVKKHSDGTEQIIAAVTREDRE